MVPANFNQLYYFWSAAKYGSISAAAKQLLLNQSTVSLQLKQLEAALGKPLLVRGRHGTTLTDAGKVCFEYCERIFTHAEELVAALRDDRPTSTPAFRLGVSQSVSRDKVLAVMRFVKELRPGVRVKIVSRSSEELEARMERRVLDMAVSDLDLASRLGRDYRSRLVSNTRLYFVSAPVLRKKMGAFPAGLARVPLLLRAPENPVRKEVDHFLHRKGIRADIHAEIEDPDLIRAMALRGEGAAVADLMSVQADVRRGRLVRLHSGPIGVRECVWFICGRRRDSRPAPQRVIDLLMSRFRFQ